jgi:hypothetical protein
MWCNVMLPETDLARCPTCGTLLKPVDYAASAAAATRVPPPVLGVRAADVASSLGELPHDVYAPPSYAVRAAMRDIERELRHYGTVRTEAELRGDAEARVDAEAAAADAGAEAAAVDAPDATLDSDAAEAMLDTEATVEADASPRVDRVAAEGPADAAATQTPATPPASPDAAAAD